MVLVTSGHEAPMNLSHKIGRCGPVGRKLTNPSVGLHRGAGLPLRARMQFLWRHIGPDCLIQLSLGELRALYSARTCHLALELQLLERLDPALLVREGRERSHCGLGFNKGRHYGV